MCRLWIVARACASSSQTRCDSVETKLGAIAFTRTPSLPIPAANDRTIDVTPPLAAVYESRPAQPTSASTVLETMIEPEPWAIICRPTCLRTWNVPVRWMSIMRCQTSSSSSVRRLSCVLTNWTSAAQW